MRVRLTATVCLLVAITLAVAGLLVYAVQTERLNEQVNRAVQQELKEFANLQGSHGRDAAVQFTSSEELFVSFIRRNVPDEDELLIGWIDDGATIRYSPRDQEQTAQDPAVREAIRAHLTDGGSERIRTDGAGELLVTVQPVSYRADRGTPRDALVIVTFLDVTREALRSTMQTYTVIAALLLVTVTAIAWWRSGRLLAPLRDLREAAADITTRDLSRRLTERGNDDITALTGTFNDMLDRLESGVTTQRQFLDDAGHELKTPLTVLRGHLELLDPDDPDEVAQTRDLLLDEVDRMSRLVGDLIVLAKTRRPDFLSRQPIDLTDLTQGVYAKARALGDRTWILDSTATGRAELDEQRITQAVLQLADNAVKHTDPGDEIGVGTDVVSTRNGSWLRLWVRDTGDGVAPEDRDRIFERFGRGQARPPDEGFGLGLSIVRAIAEAHRGSVELVDPERRSVTPVEPYEDPDPDHTGEPGVASSAVPLAEASGTDPGRTGAWFVITLPYPQPTEGDEQWPAS